MVCLKQCRKRASFLFQVSLMSTSRPLFHASILLFHASILKSYPFMHSFAYLHPFQLSNLAIHFFCPFLPSSLHSYMKTNFRFRPCPTGAVWDAKCVIFLTPFAGRSTRRHFHPHRHRRPPPGNHLEGKKTCASARARIAVHVRLIAAFGYNKLVS